MTDRIPVSVVVISRDEERNIAKCLRSAERFGETFVVDSNSADRTAEIATSLGARVVQFSWDGSYPKKKQWSLENLPFSYDWVLFLDADEELYPETIGEIAELMRGNPDCAGYFAAYDYVFLGRVLRHGHRIYKLILHDRRRSRFPEYPDLDARNAGENEFHVHPYVDGPVGVLRHRVLHNDHDDLAHFFDRHNRYSDWEALMRSRGALPDPREAQPGVRRLLKRTFAALPLKGAVAFLHSYALRLGFLDGRAGLHFALARAFYYWQIELKRRELEQGRA